jgi:protein ImuA
MGLDPVDETGREPSRADPRARLAALRARLAPPAGGSAGELAGGSTAGPAGRPVLSLGPRPPDACLPGGGLVLGPPHEIAPAGPADTVAALGFALALCARRLAQVHGEALIAAAPGQPLPYGHGLTGLGLDPGRVLLLEAGSDAEVFRALEAALRARSLAAVIGLLRDGMPLKPGRRLQLAAEGPAPPLLLILRPAEAGLPNGAATRWRIAAAPASRDRFGTLDRPRWRARLERCRNGRGGDWLLEWDREAHRLHLPEPLAGDAAAAGRSRA